ncbi:MAG: PIN domain-containing protein [Candidatus Bathyarchaeia archaeon]
MKIVVDTYAWIEIFLGSGKGNKAREILAEAREVYTPDIVLAEVARKYFRERVEPQVVLDRLKKITEASDVTSISVEVAVESAKCFVELSERTETASLFDAMVLAVARVLEAKVVTGDKHFRNLPETLWIGESLS